MHLLVSAATAAVALAYVQIPIVGSRSNKHPIPRYNKFVRRDDSFTLQLQNQVSFYRMTVEIGTPSQTTAYTIDTGSSDVWIMASTNPFCSNDPAAIANGTGVDCSGANVFDYKKSSTFKVNSTSGNADFAIHYGDDSVAIGNWATDVMNIGGNTLKSASFAVATRANSSHSVFGIGLQDTESTFASDIDGAQSYVYDNVPILLKSNGFIKTISYSLWLNSLDQSTGSILFGGIDTDAYSGTLGLVPMVKLDPNEPTVDPSKPGRLSVQLMGIDVFSGNAGGNGNSQWVAQGQFPILLDSGTTLTYLPTEIVEIIGRSVGGTYSRSVGLYIIPCQGSGGLRFDFSGVKIDVPINELVTPLTDDSGNLATDQHGTPICGLGILPTEDSFILGDNFLRSAYVVYDLENFQVALAQAKTGASATGGGNIVEIDSAIPSASSAPSYSSTEFVNQFTTQLATSFISFSKGKNATPLLPASGFDTPLRSGDAGGSSLASEDLSFTDLPTSGGETINTGASGVRTSHGGSGRPLPTGALSGSGIAASDAAGSTGGGSSTGSSAGSSGSGGKKNGATAVKPAACILVLSAMLAYLV